MLILGFFIDFREGNDRRLYLYIINAHNELYDESVSTGENNRK